MRMEANLIGMALQHLCQRTIQAPGLQLLGVTGRSFAISNLYKLVSLFRPSWARSLVLRIRLLRCCGT